MLLIGQLSEPLNMQTGDRLERHGSMLLQIRKIDNHDVVVKSVTILGETKVGYGTYSVVGVAGNVTQVILEKHMPGATDSIVSIVEAPDHKVTINFGSGTSETHDSWSDIGSIADEIDTDGNFARKLLKAMAFRSSPGGENKTACVGASATVNVQPQSVPVVYTPPQD